MVTIKYIGPVRAEIDEETQSAKLGLRRSGPESQQLLDSEILAALTWYATKLENEGYTVDYAGVAGFDLS